MPKDFQSLSKRRKNKLIHTELNRYKDSTLLHSTPLNISSNLLDKAEFTSTSSDNSSCRSCMSPECANEINKSSIESQFETQNNEEQNVEIKYEISEVTNVSNYTNNITLRDDLQTFIIDCNITHDAASDLLAILRKHGHVELPKDVRALLQNQQRWWPRTASSANCTFLESARKGAVNASYEMTDKERLSRGKRRHTVYNVSDEEQHDNRQCRKYVKGKQINISSVTTVPSCPSNFQIRNKHDNVPQVASGNNVYQISQNEKENNPVPSTFNEKLHSDMSNIPIIIEGYEQPTENIQDDNIKEKLDQMLRMQAATNISLRNINQRLYKIEDAIRRRARSPVETNNDLIAQFLPLKTIEDIKQFECLLKTSNESVTQFKQFLSKTGGNNAKDNVQRCLKKLITNECAMKCSWKGLRNNFRVCNLYFIKIMKKEITSHYSTFTETDFDNSTAEWLRFGSQRHKRENQAKENNTNYNECDEYNECNEY